MVANVMNVDRDIVDDGCNEEVFGGGTRIS